LSQQVVYLNFNDNVIDLLKSWAALAFPANARSSEQSGPSLFSARTSGSSAATTSGRFAFVDHAVEVRGGEFYIMMFVLPGAAFRLRSLHSDELSRSRRRETCIFFGLLVLLIINTQVPLAYSCIPCERMKSFSCSAEG